MRQQHDSVKSTGRLQRLGRWMLDKADEWNRKDRELRMLGSMGGRDFADMGTHRATLEFCLETPLERSLHRV